MGLKRRPRSDKYEDNDQICHVAAVSVNITTPTAIFVARDYPAEWRNWPVSDPSERQE